MSNKRILVPGGAGYIGAHTVAALVESGAQVVVVDDLETGFKQAVDPAAKFYQGDIRDKAFLDGVFEKEPIDAVIHFAAYSQVGESMENPLKYYDNNLNGTRVLLSSMIEHDVKKIVFSSTAATYGEPRNIPILESDPTEPTNAYGATKLAMEGMMRWCARAYGLKFVSLRYFNACGAHSRGHILRAGLHPCDGPVRSPSAGGGLPAVRRGKRRVQPGQRGGLHGQGGHPGCGRGGRGLHPRQDRPPAGR